jgi:outer membrane lipoprotein-sorting protein
MKKYRYFLLLFLSLTLGTALLAQPKGYKAMKDTAQFRKNFNDKSKSILTNEADFVQEKYVSVMTDKAISKGKFYYKKPNLMRWENTEPASHIIVLNNGKMMIKEKNKTKVYDANSNKMFKNLNDMMLTTASGNMLNNKDYKYSLFENEKYYLIELKPVNASAKKFIATIDIMVEKADYTVSQIKMNEPSEDYTKIEFMNKKLNAGIRDELFTLK